jgi:hypothetical protein
LMTTAMMSAMPKDATIISTINVFKSRPSHQPLEKASLRTDLKKIRNPFDNKWLNNGI